MKEKLFFKRGKRTYVFDPDTLEVFDKTEGSGSRREKIELVEPPDTPTITTLFLEVTYQCNFACKYCFTMFEGYYGKGDSMSIETMEASIDFLIKYSKNESNLGVVFFGGEPLLEFSSIKRIVPVAIEKARKNNKKIRFFLVTNGSLLTSDIFRFLSLHEFSLQIGIDGNPLFHNQTRPYRNGSPSFLDIIHNIKKLYNFPDLLRRLSLRSTILPGWGPYFKDIFSFLFSFKPASIMLSPVIPSGPQDHFAWNDESVEQLNEGVNDFYRYFRSHLVRGNPPGLSSFRRLINPLLIKGKHSPYPCGAGNEHLTIATDGSVYPCFTLVGREKFKCGNVHDGEMDPKTGGFATISIENPTRDKCRECFAAYLCKGGCPHENIIFTSDLEKPPEYRCKITRNEVKNVIELYIDLMESGKIDKFAGTYIFPMNVEF